MNHLIEDLRNLLEDMEGDIKGTPELIRGC
jgi:hypothetical protein